MKKFIIFTFLIFINVTCFAQLNITAKTSERPVEVCKLNGTAHSLMHSSYGYFIWLRTDNQFDDFMTVSLGETKDEAIQSLNDLLNLLNTEETVVILNHLNEKLTLYATKFSGINCLFVSCKGYAGNGWIYKAMLNKAITRINNFKE